MIDPEHVLKARLRWVQMRERTQNAALTCVGAAFPKPLCSSGGVATKIREKRDYARKADALTNCASARSLLNMKSSSWNCAARVT